MGAFADWVGGMIAGERGDVEGFNKGVTKEGRQRLALERQNQTSEQQMIADVLRRAQADPELNAYLQKQMQPFLSNETLREQTRGGVAARQGQELSNVRSGNVNEFFKQHGGSPESATFGLQQTESQDRSGLTRAQTAGVRGQTAASGYNLKSQIALDQLAQSMNYPNFHSLQFDLDQNIRNRQLGQTDRHLNQTDTQIMQGAGAREAETFGRMYGDTQPNFQTGQPSEAQRAIARKMGMELPEDQQTVMAREAMKRAEAKAQEKRVGKQRPQTAVGPAPSAGAVPPFQEPFQGLGGPMEPPGPMRGTAEAMLRKLGFDTQETNNYQHVLNLLRAMTGGAVDVTLQGDQR